MSLQKALDLYIEGIKLCDQSRDLWDERINKIDSGEDELWSIRDKSNVLWYKGHILCNESREIWKTEIIKLFGFIPDYIKSIEDFV